MGRVIGRRRPEPPTGTHRSVTSFGRCARAAFAVGLLASVLGIGRGAGVSAQSPTSPEQELVDRHVPVVKLKAQTGPCDAAGEAFAPASVDIVLDNPQVFVRQLGTGDPVLQHAPSPADLGRLGAAFYLDFPGDALEPGCIYEEDFRRFAAGSSPTVYAHIVTQPDVPGRLVVQYWFWWYFNDWNNTHESDWEMIQVVFEASSVEEALAEGPSETGFAQHEGGERADWDGEKLERVGDHPVVYPSAGSHASYYSSAHYLGRGAAEGFGCDTTEGPSNTVQPQAVLLPDPFDPADEEFGWLAFEGHWGERHDGAFNGPTGPATKEQWTRPMSFQNDLRDSSVVVPGGGTFGDSAINAFCGAVEWGSRLLVAVKSSPARVAVALFVLALLARSLIRSTAWRPHVELPVRRRRTAGQILHGAARIYRGNVRAFLWIGLVYVPIGAVTAAVVHLVSQIGAIEGLLQLATRNSAVGAIITALLGGLGNLIAFLVVSAVVAAALDRAGEGQARGAGAYRLAAARWRPLASALVRAVAVVAVLFVSIVGIPWGIRQLVRYQLIPQVVMLEGLGGAAAVRRSSELVRHRWWRVAWIVALLNLATVFVAIVTAMLLLIAFSFLPLWSFTVIAALVFGLVVPYTAIAFTLIYGDRVAAAAQRSSSAGPDALADELVPPATTSGA